MLTLFREAFAPPRHLILVLAAAWVGQALAEKRAGEEPGLRSAVDSLAVAMLAAFLIGGRIFFAIGHIAAFAQSPISLVSLNTDLFDSWGGAVCAAAAVLAVSQRKGLRLWQMLDLLTPLFAALAIGVSLSHLASGAAFGSETNVPWAILLWDAPRHPTQIYELCAGILALAVIWFRRGDPVQGNNFLLWVAIMAAGRLIMEAFRGDSTLVFGGLRLAQILAWIVLAAALVGLELLRAPQKNAPTRQEVSASKM